MNQEELKQRLIALLNKTFNEQYEKRRLLTEVHTAEALIANGVTIRERGEWKDNTFCSRCGYFAEDGEGHIMMSFDDFCPRCGADMRGVKDE